MQQPSHQQHTSDNVYDNGGGGGGQHLQSQQQHYLSSSPHVQQPLPASTMASSVAALQRLSASIDVTAVPATASAASAAAAGSSRSNSRASAYNEDTSDKSDAQVAAQSREAAEAAAVAQAAADASIVGRGNTDSGRPQYLTANCVVYSFYNGDLTAAIDDHFNRALKTSNERDSPNHSSESAKQQSGMSFPVLFLTKCLNK